MSVSAVDWLLSDYVVLDPGPVITPALLIYPEKVRTNIRATLKMVGGEADRWRPHIKTAKLSAVIKTYVLEGIRQFKCSTTLELRSACEAGAKDVLVAFSMVGRNAERLREIATSHPGTRVSVLIESAAQAKIWLGGGIGVFLDLNSGMNRTGMEPDQVQEMMSLASSLGANFRGLHWYDGHVSMVDTEPRQRLAFTGYDRLMEIVGRFKEAQIAIGEVVTSGTPTAPYGYLYAPFRTASFVQRISPGTVVYNDLSSLKQLSDYGYVPAALVMATVISHPKPGIITCDAGHKAVGVDSGVPNCHVVGHPELTPLKPSEEHLPMQVESGCASPAVGEKLYLLAKHVCPTVNNFDQALMIDHGKIVGIEAVDARGHENPLNKN